MSAHAFVSGATATWVVATLVFVAALLALATDRRRIQRRVAHLEQAEALCRTDLADARAEIDRLRDCLQARSGRTPGVTEIPRGGLAPGTPAG